MAEAILLSALVQKFGGRLAGSDRLIHDVASLKNAGAGHLSFLADKRLAAAAVKTNAAALAVKEDFALPVNDKSYWLTPDPYLYFARVSAYFHPRPLSRGTIAPSAVIAADAVIGTDVEIGPGVIIGAGVVIGAGTIIMAATVIAAGVRLGTACFIHPAVTVLDGSVLGNEVEIHSGTVIGADGFGLAWNGEGWEKIPQIGIVEIKDRVEIGANVTIDRGTLDNTVIEEGVKIDNLVQIAHNCKIGAHTAIAAMVGMAGGTVIGKFCQIAGAAKFTGHLTVADGVLVAGAAVVSRSLTQKGGQYAGSYPLSELQSWRHNAVYVRRLQTMAAKINKLEKLQGGLAADTEEEA